MAENYLESLAVKELGGMLDNKRYWDLYSCEWQSSTVKSKLAMLGMFVKKGGDLNAVLDKYAERHEEMYRSVIQEAVLVFIGTLMTGEEFIITDELCRRVKRLDKEELVLLLTEELRRNVFRSGRYDYAGVWQNDWIVGKEHLLDDSILDTIELRHWQNNPDESFEAYLHKEVVYWGYEDYSKSLW